MNLTERINNDIKEAMKAQDKGRLEALRAIKSAILLANTDGTGKPLDEEREIGLLQKLVKQRKESLEIYEKQNRVDLANVEAGQLAVISEYLPKPLTEGELEAMVRAAIEQTGAASVKDMGKVVGVVMKQANGRAEGSAISGMVKRLLPA